MCSDPQDSTASLDPKPHSSVHHLFERQARNTPNAVAVEFEGTFITYGELDHRSNQLARYLQENGVGPDVLVAFAVDRKIEMIIGLLGILKAGGAYVPLDPSYPNKRLAYMLEHSKASVLLTEQHLLSQLPAFSGVQVCLDRDASGIEDITTEPLEQFFDSSNLAYVIYTSGSTGRPKGVEISHSAVVNMLASIQQVPGMTAADRVFAITTLSFDISVTEIFLPLAVGACICLLDQLASKDAVVLSKKLAESNVSYMQATPATWRMLLEVGWEGQPDLQIISGGEALTRDLADKLLPRCRELWNLYGPTEATVWASTYQVQSDDGAVPVGTPIINTEFWLLDDNQKPVPNGETGELFIGGKSLARGYLNDPEQTMEKFIPHLFSDSSGARLYRTGDLGCFQKDGNLLHLGRTDHQVKVRGFRIELGEIEGALEQDSSVSQAVVAAQSYDIDDTRLVAYIKSASASASESEPDRSSLRAALAKSLPEYMVPSTFVFLDSFPLTPSGKIDRNALPSVKTQQMQDIGDYIAPSNELEKKLALLVSKVLKIERISVAEDLFNLGADSLKITQMIARIRDQFQVELEQRTLFDNSTVAGIAELIENAKKDLTCSVVKPIECISRDGHLPLSFAQQRVWFIHQLYPENLAYNFQCTIRMRGPLDILAIEAALNAITYRHEIYRTTYAWLGDQPTQIVHDYQEWKLPRIDFSTLNEAEASQAADVWYKQAFNERYDPTKLPMARWCLLKFGEKDHTLVHMEHHLVHDGWSFNLFLKELIALYSAQVETKSTSLKDLPIQFVDFAAWERQHMQSSEADRQLQYWKEKLNGLAPLLELRGCKPRPAEPRFVGAAPRVEIPLSTCQSLRQLGRSHRATLFMTMLTGFIVLLHRASDRTDIPVGTVFANRRHAASESLIGMILNNVVIRASLELNPTFSQLLKQVRTLVLEASSNQEVPFDRVVEAIDPPRNAGYNPLFQVFFGFHDEPMPDSGPKDLDIKVTPVISNGSSKFDLGVIVIPHSAKDVGLKQGSEKDGLTLVWEHNTDLFESETIDQMIRDYGDLLDEMVNHPDQSVLKAPSESPLNQGTGSRLPEPALINAPQEIISPRNSLEADLMEIWKDVIGAEDFGVHEDFFDLGGHSLLAMKIIVRVRDKLDHELSLRDFFDHGTIAAIAEVIQAS